jgi:hypothetical protein
MTSDGGPVDLVRYQVSHLMRNRVGLEFGDVLHQEHGVISNQVLVEEGLAGRPAAQVKSHLGHREVAAVFLARQGNELGGCLERALLDDDRHHLGPCAHSLDYTRQR